MRIEKLPEFAQKYKVKGYDVKKKDNSYYLYQITHVQKPDKNYITTKYVYVGRITESGDLIKAHVEVEKPIKYLEYGLSAYIYTFHRRTLQRSLFNVVSNRADNLILLGIINYIFGMINEEVLRYSYLTYKNAKQLFEFYNSNEINAKRVLTLTKRIEKIFKEKISDEANRTIFIASLRNMNAVYYSDNKVKIYDVYSTTSEEIAKEFKFKL